MARANFVKKCQKDIYENGKYVNYTGKRGKREGMTLSKIDRTVPANKSDKILIAKGESYYWWQFKNSPKHYSKERPKQSQLTQSNYFSTLYSIQEGFSDSLDDATCAEDLVSAKDDAVSELESLKDETENSLSNMPDSLQSSPTGELLQERIDSLDNAISELEGIDLDYDEPDEDEMKKDIADDEHKDADELLPDVLNDMVEEKKEEQLREWLDEKISELQDVSFE